MLAESEPAPARPPPVELEVVFSCDVFSGMLIWVWAAARLRHWGWTNNYFCAFYERNLETAQRLFFECPFARQVWNQVADWCSLNSLNPSSWEEKRDLDWFAQAIPTGDKEGHSLVILTLWCLWNQRNAIVFREKQSSVQGALVDIKNSASYWSLAGVPAFSLPSVVQLDSE
jgi:hypothetical protein